MTLRYDAVVIFNFVKYPIKTKPYIICVGGHFERNIYVMFIESCWVEFILSKFEVLTPRKTGHKAFIFSVRRAVDFIKIYILILSVIHISLSLY